MIADRNIDAVNFIVQGRPNLALEQPEAAEYRLMKSGGAAGTNQRRVRTIGGSYGR